MKKHPVCLLCNTKNLICLRTFKTWQSNQLNLCINSILKNWSLGDLLDSIIKKKNDSGLRDLIIETFLDLRNLDNYPNSLDDLSYKNNLNVKQFTIIPSTKTTIKTLDEIINSKLPYQQSLPFDTKPPPGLGYIDHSKLPSNLEINNLLIDYSRPPGLELNSTSGDQENSFYSKTGLMNIACDVAEFVLAESPTVNLDSVEFSNGKNKMLFKSESNGKPIIKEKRRDISHSDIQSGELYRKNIRQEKFDQVKKMLKIFSGGYLNQFLDFLKKESSELCFYLRDNRGKNISIAKIMNGIPGFYTTIDDNKRIRLYYSDD